MPPEPLNYTSTAAGGDQARDLAQQLALRGVFPVVQTPFNAHGRIDEDPEPGG